VLVLSEKGKIQKINAADIPDWQRTSHNIALAQGRLDD
jgi:hypothetical protein